MSWNFRVVYADDVYSLREVSYDADGQPDGYSADAVALRGFDPEFEGDEHPLVAMAATMERMKAALDKPILDECEGEKLVERKAVE